MRNTIHKVRIGFAIALVLALAIVALSYRTTAKLLDTSRVVARTNDAVASLDGTVAALNNLERSRLAWVMAGTAMHNLRAQRARRPACGLCHSPHTRPVEAERFRNTHLKMLADLTRHTQELSTLIASEPGQRERLRSLEALVEQKSGIAKAEIPSERTENFNELQAGLLEKDAHLTGEIRSIIADLEQEEGKLLARQLQERTAAARTEILAVSLLVFLTVCTAVVAYAIIRRDLAQRRALEEQLRQTTKMEVVGRLAGGVAHDFNNLLLPVVWCAEMLASDLGEDHAAMAHVNDIKKAAETATSVARQLLTFSSRQAVHDMQRLNLNTVGTDMSNLLRRLVGDQYQLETVWEPALGWVKANSSEIEQVVMNLVLNARDAMPGGGIIAIETANVNLNGERKCWCGLPLKGSFVVLAVSDDGEGMDEETCARVFEPFFTTKERGKGTGLGLATVYGIVTQSNGRVRVRSAIGRGTTLEVYLPRVEAPAKIVRAAGLEPGIPSVKATILVVEDDEAIYRLLGGALAAAGHHVLQARDGEEGLLVAQAFKKRIDLAISDVMMPKVNGLELYHKLSALHPGLRTIFTSGYTASSVNVASVLNERTIFLAKPFTPGELLEKVGLLLRDMNQTEALRKPS